MDSITKDDIISAFALKRKGKLNLLYLYFKDQYFHKGLSAELIARKLSEALNLPITPTHIYDIHRRYVPATSVQDNKALELNLDQLKALIRQQVLSELRQEQISQQPIDLMNADSSPALSDSETTTAQTHKRSLTYVNQEDEPKKNPYIDLMKGL
ncbi:hypothetical protein [Xanthocytophaga agilis]|uniref:Uncharacterized protein n=1 Tax=Xanthocytophaga agilis TaxID=3048010 RepID=A0AAE3R7H5_9BACT|nr:hypothetical protein [Xanthocytophaga agilis]MDJ1505256.1 hypothetical protein [Xanthocytophaga agilis]